MLILAFLVGFVTHLMTVAEAAAPTSTEYSFIIPQSTRDYWGLIDKSFPNSSVDSLLTSDTALGGVQ
jgi:hypothetical protein